VIANKPLLTRYSQAIHHVDNHAQLLELIEEIVGN